MSKTKHCIAEDDRLTTIQLASRYGVSVALLDQWRRYNGFPNDAALRKGASLLWDYRIVDRWLARRPIAKTGPAPKWRNVIEGLAV